MALSAESFGRKTPDPVVVQRGALQNFFLHTYRLKKPVLAYSAPLVKSGALLWLYATPAQLGFLANPRYRAQLAETAAGVVVLRAEDADARTGSVLVARDPYTAFAKIAALFERKPARDTGIHPTAAIAPSATVDASAHIGPHVSIGANSKVGAGAMIGPGCVVGDDCEVGEGCELVARVTLVTRVRLGKRVLVHPGAVLGAAGVSALGFATQWTGYRGVFAATGLGLALLGAWFGRELRRL
jgi:UDP-3-O-[3-hydroxymyristoyl] glucosamine N-acyltransferase LpxD